MAIKIIMWNLGFQTAILYIWIVEEIKRRQEKERWKNIYGRIKENNKNEKRNSN